jgi:outer membrane protein TolC
LIENLDVKRRRNRCSSWPLILIGGMLTAFPALLSAQVSLSTVVDLAQRNSSAVKLAQASKSKAEAALLETKEAYLPSLTFGSGLPAFPNVGFSGGVPSIFNGTIQSLVMNVPQLQYIRAARAGLESASLSLNDAREQVALDASIFYIELDTVNRSLEVARQQENYADRLIKIEEERAEAGVDPLSELLQAKLTRAQLKIARLRLETRAAILAKQLATLAGLPVASVVLDHASIPEIPQLHADDSPRTTFGIEAAQKIAQSKQKVARGDSLSGIFPQIVFEAQYSRSTTIFNDADRYYVRPIPANNFSSGFSVQIPLFDFVHLAKAKGSKAEALRATVEAEQAQRQNEVQITQITGNLRELDTLAEIANLKQQIADQQLHAVLAQLELGNGAGTEAGAQPQLSPKAEQLARIEERQKYQDAQDTALDLSKARLNLMRALGHMQDWLDELHGK